MDILDNLRSALLENVAAGREYSLALADLNIAKIEGKPLEEFADKHTTALHHKIAIEGKVLDAIAEVCNQGGVVMPSQFKALEDKVRLL